MVRVEPTVTREGAITLVRQFAPTDRVTRSPAGRRCALAVDDGAWVIDLDEALRANAAHTRKTNTVVAVVVALIFVGFVLALPRPDGSATITRGGAPAAETPARLGPPDQLHVDGPCAELAWTPQPTAPWHRGYIR